MTTRPSPTYHRAIAKCLFTLLTAVMCVGLVAAVALLPAPPAVLVLVIAVCVGYPMVVATRSADAIAVVRDRWVSGRLHQRALGDLRRELDLLPEIGHPLDC